MDGSEKYHIRLTPKNEHCDAKVVGDCFKCMVKTISLPAKTSFHHGAKLIHNFLYKPICK